MHQLVEHSPFVSDDGTVYIADKVSQFYVIDRSSGELIAEFDAAESATQEKNGNASSKPVSRLLLGRHQLRVKAVNPITKQASWRAQLSYVPTVRSLDAPREDAALDEELADPGSYFYHQGAGQNQLYAVDRVTGGLCWWQDLPGPAMAVHIIGDSGVAEERFLMPSASALGGEMDLWRSRILVGDEHQFVQVGGASAVLCQTTVHVTVMLTVHANGHANGTCNGHANGICGPQELKFRLRFMS